MRNLIIFVLLSLNLVAQKSPKDIVDVNNFDYVYAEKLLHDKFVTELGKMFNDGGSFTKDSIACKAIEYQLSHFKNGGKFSHRNTEKFRGVLLPFVDDRFLYFYKRNLGHNYILECSEVCFYMNYTNKMTYESIINDIFNTLMNSVSHKTTIIYAYEDNFKCFWKLASDNSQNSMKIWAGGFFYLLH